MCDPVTMAVVSVANAGMQYKQQKAQAKDRYDQQKDKTKWQRKMPNSVMRQQV